MQPTCSMLRMESLVSSNLKPAPLPQQRASRSALQRGVWCVNASMSAAHQKLAAELPQPTCAHLARCSLHLCRRIGT